MEGSFRRREVINKSVFITTLVRAESPEQAAEEIRKIRKEFSDATHNCYAFSAGQYKKSSDDGEPAGTAGQPMAEVLKKRGADMLVAVVTRYFGGIKLGAGGLIGAYSGNVARALDEAPMRLYRPSAVMKIEVAYALASKTEALLGAAGAIIDSRDWEGCARFTAALPEEEAEKVCLAIADMSAGGAKISKMHGEYRAYKLK